MSRIADDWAREELATLSKRGLSRQLESLSSAQGAHVLVGDEPFVNLCSNDYLGLCGDPRLADAARAELSKSGFGSGASRLVTGDFDVHHRLESAAAAFVGAEAAVVFNSGFAANTGVLAALCGEGDVVFSDALNHASIIDGCRLSRAKVVVYPHGDHAALVELLSANAGRRRLVVTESIFSMDGDVAPLRELSRACVEAGAALFVDEAHAIGVRGPRGEGLCAELGVTPDLRTATLGKSVGAFGAFVAGSRALCELLVNRARSFVYSTALPPLVCAAAIEGLRIVAAEPERRAKLRANIDRIAVRLGRVNHPSAIFPIVLGSPERALAASRRLREAGLLVKAIRPPTVPEGTSRLRLSLSAAHSYEDLDHALNVLETQGILNGG